MKRRNLQYDIYQRLLSCLEKSGVSPEQLLNRAHKKGLSVGKCLSISDDTKFSGLDIMCLLEAAEELSGDTALAMRIGQQINIESYGTFGFALMTCATQRDAIFLLERYKKIFSGPPWQIIEQDKDLTLRVNCDGLSAKQTQMTSELCFSQLASIGKSLRRLPNVNRMPGTNPIEKVEIEFTHPEPPHADLYIDIFPGKIAFNRDSNQIHFPADFLDMPVKTANPYDYIVFKQQCAELLSNLDNAEKITSAVRVLLIQSAGSFLKIGEVADQLDISERTLRRRLNVEATNFSRTLDEIRNLLAREYLTQTNLIVAEIAHLLGYEETANFRRAFKRWNGLSPNQYRSEKYDNRQFLSMITGMSEFG